jgi:hypothetical protein
MIELKFVLVEDDGLFVGDGRLVRRARHVLEHAIRTRRELDVACGEQDDETRCRSHGHRTNQSNRVVSAIRHCSRRSAVSRQDTDE